MLSLILAIIGQAPLLLPLLDDAFTAAPSIEGLIAAFASEGALKVLASLSFAQWISIAEKVAAAAPAAQKALAALHPAFAELVADIGKGLESHDAAANARAWFGANAPAFVPGYGADGSVKEIPNPDLNKGE